MEEKVIKCLETVGQAIKELIISANNEAEMMGLMVMFLGGWEETYKKAIDEGVEEIEKREEEEGK
jgi:hypothetical protein